MARRRVTLALTALAFLSACATRRPTPPPPPPPPPPTPVTAPRPAPTPSLGWQEAPLTPGDWAYRAGAAEFAGPDGPLFRVACEPGSRIALLRIAPLPADALTVRTTLLERSLAASPIAPGIVARLPAGDPLFDAIAFSRGRIAVEAGTAPDLILPAWPEIGRVVEDCRS